MTHALEPDVEFEPNNSREPHNNPIHEAVEFYWGERCSEHMDGCPTCVAWRLYDEIIKEGLK
jgi:hypothetical protein